jgi:hypothetical protein
MRQLLTHSKGATMPILNYLAIPKEGAGETTCAELSVLNYGRVIPADNQDIVVTDIPDEKTIYYHQIQGIKQ